VIQEGEELPVSRGGRKVEASAAASNKGLESTKKKGMLGCLRKGGLK